MPQDICGLSAAVLLWLCFPTLAQAQPHEPWTVECATTRGIHDGDTFVCVPADPDAKDFSVRVAGADAPETGQAHWRAARKKLRELLRSGAVVSCYKRDRWGREVCRVQQPSGGDAALALIEAGLAWHAIDYAHEQSATEAERFRAAEMQSRSARIGLWAEPNPMPPNECRAMKRSRRSCR